VSGEWSPSLYGRFAPGKSPLFRLNIRKGQPQSQYGDLVKRRISVTCWELNTFCGSRSPFPVQLGG